MKIEMTEAQHSEIREILLEKRLRLEYSATALEIRLKLATLKLKDLVKMLSMHARYLADLESDLSLMNGVSAQLEEMNMSKAKLAAKIYMFQKQVDVLIVKVLFELPLAVAMEKAQLVVIERYLETGEMIFFEAEAA